MQKIAVKKSFWFILVTAIWTMLSEYKQNWWLNSFTEDLKIQQLESFTRCVFPH